MSEGHGDSVEGTDDLPVVERGKRSRFAPSENPQPDDRIPVSLPRWLTDLVAEQRDRLDPASDSLGRKRSQQSRDAFVERLVRYGLKWARTLPDWHDPLAFEDD